ncbi:5' nucleotidase, NT5C type [Virgibacillus kimchii]
MRFGFDIDDTLINLREHAFYIYRKKLNNQVPLEVFQGLDRVEIHEPFGLTDAEGKDMWESSLEEIYYTDCPPFPGAVETLKKLAADKHEIYYITARPEKHGERTKEWMKERGFPIRDDRFYYGMKDEEKIHIIKNLKLDYYVDDKPAVLETLINENMHILVKDQSYNRDVAYDRIIDWSDFPLFI